MKSKRLLKLLSAICLAALIAIPFAAGCAAPTPAPAPAPAPAEKYTLEWHYSSPASSPAMVEAFNGVVDRINNKSGGRLEIKVFYKGTTPFAAADVVYAVSQGQADMVRTFFLQFTGVNDVFEYSTLPGLVRDFEGNVNLVQDVIKPYMDDLFRTKYNSKLLALNGMTPFVACLKKPIKKVSDFEGVRLPVRSPTQMDFWDRLGGIPITIPYAEVITALKTNLVDGATTSPDYLIKQGFSESAPYFHPFPLAATTHGIFINQDTWAKLPADLQNLVRDEFKKGEADYDAYNLRRDSEMVVEMSTAPHEFIALTPEVGAAVEKAAADTIAAWLADPKRSSDAKKLLNQIYEYQGK